MRRFGALLVALGLIGFLAGSLSVWDGPSESVVPPHDLEAVTPAPIDTSLIIDWPR